MIKAEGVTRQILLCAKSCKEQKRVCKNVVAKCREIPSHEKKCFFFNASVLQPSSASSASVLQPSSSSSCRVAREPPMQIADDAPIEIEKAHMEVTFSEVSFGHISYGSSEWFWAMNGAAAPPRQPEQLMTFFATMSL